jgi:hypothetical protein
MSRHTFCSNLPLHFDELPLYNRNGYEVGRLHAVQVVIAYEITPDGQISFDIHDIEARQYAPMMDKPQIHRAYGDADPFERPIYDTLTDVSQRYFGEIMDAIRADADDEPDAPQAEPVPTPASEYVLL